LGSNFLVTSSTFTRVPNLLLSKIFNIQVQVNWAQIALWHQNERVANLVFYKNFNFASPNVQGLKFIGSIHTKKLIQIKRHEFSQEEIKVLLRDKSLAKKRFKFN